jgi:DNA primase
MFPIHNLTGKVVAFGGRIMVKDEKAPKYVNTPESEVYQKSKILYALNFAKNEIRKKDECLLVEGYTDVISLHQAGIENVVSSSGTALTVEQIRLIKRITPNITMLYDGDAAGIKAALRGTDLVLEEGMNVRIVILPFPEDPDSYVRKVGEDAFSKYIRDNRKDLILFKTSLFAEEAKKDPIKKAELIRDIVDSICKIPDAIQRSVYVKECSQVFDMNEQVLITEVNKTRRKKARDEAKHESDAQDKEALKTEEVPQAVHQEQFNELATHIHIIEKDIVRIIVEFGAWKTEAAEEAEYVIEYILSELEGIDLETTDYKALFDLVKREWADKKVHDEKYFINHDDPVIAALALDVLSQPYNLSENWWNKYKIAIPEKKTTFIKDIQSSVMRLKQYRNIAELKKIEHKLKDAANEIELTKLMKLHKLLLEQKKEFARTIGNVVYKPVT